jgi:hypothetical protein
MKSQTMKKDHLTWSDFMDHGLNQPLVEEKGYEMTRAHFTIIWPGTLPHGIVHRAFLEGITV